MDISDSPALMRGWRRSSRMVTGLVWLVAVLVAAAMGVMMLWACGGQKPNITGLEGNIVFGVQRLLLGEALYQSPSAPPFAIIQYSPAYYYLCAGVSRLLQVSPFDPRAVTMVGRSISSLWFIATLAMMVMTVTRIFGVRLSVALAGAGLLALGLSPWAFLIRSESMAGFFIFATVALGLVAQERGGTEARVRGVLMGAALAAVLAVAAKQSGVIAPIILVGWFLITRQWRRLFFVTGCLAAFTVVVVGITLAFTGPAVRANVYDGIRNGLDLTLKYVLLNRWGLVYLGVFTPAVMVAAGAALYRPRRHGEHFLVFASVMLFLFACATVVKLGSEQNYFNDFLAVSFMLVLHRLECDVLRPDAPDRRPNALIIVAGVSILLVLPPMTKDRLNRYWRYTAVPENYYGGERYEPTAQYLRPRLEADPTIYFLNLGDPGINAYFPRHALAPQLHLIQLAYERGLVDYSRLREMVEAGRVPFLMTFPGERPGHFAGIDFSHYRFQIDLGRYPVWVDPRWSEVPATPTTAPRE